MSEHNYIEQMIRTAQNHNERAAEGRRLLSEGRPLSEMRTEITGLSGEQNHQRREDFITLLKGKDIKDLNWMFGNTMYQLHRRYEHPDKGTSELEWKRLIFLDEYARRGVEPPQVDFEKVKKGVRE